MFVRVTYGFLNFLPLLIRICFHFLIIFQSTLWRWFIIESRPNISSAGVYCVVVCTVAFRANMVEANMLSHWFLSFSTILCTLKVRRILPIVWCTLPNIAFVWGFLEVIGFTVMPWFLIINSLNSARNSFAPFRQV